MSLFLPSKPRSRLVVLGLDGLPLGLARTLAASLPNLGRLAEDAVTVRAELPELVPGELDLLLHRGGPGKTRDIRFLAPGSGNL